MTSFDRVVVVDWSAAAQPSPPRPSPDAIWIGVAEAGGSVEIYCRTRHEAEVRLRQLCAEAAGRVLVGFDFPLGYPQGFAARLAGLGGAGAVRDWIAAHLTDGPDNRSNRFALAAEINMRFPAGPGPFWGRPRGLDLPDLPERKTVDYPALGLAERRLVDTRVPRAQPVWKLYTTGSVGSQALTGLPVVARMARAGAAVWPFDPPARVILAEVFPSLLDAAVRPAAAAGEIKDAAQVRLLARALWRMGGGIGALLADVPDWPGREDEGWILGAGQAGRLLEALA